MRWLFLTLFLISSLVWDLEKKDDSYQKQNSNTAMSDYSERSGGTEGSSNDAGR